MSRIVLIISIVIVCINTSFSQRSDIGITLGSTYYVGDLNPGKHFKFSHPAGGLVLRYMLDTRFMVSGKFIYGELSAYDSESDDNYQMNRNLSFYSDVFEFSGQLEFSFFKFYNFKPHKPYCPYLFIGIGVFSFNPKTDFNDETYELHSMSTEGQGLTAFPDKVNYSLLQVSIPYGIGVRFSSKSKWSFGIEWGLRKTFTDYIDDVSSSYVDPADVVSEKGEIAGFLSDRSVDKSYANIGKQRGNSYNKDIYSYCGFSIYRNISKGTCLDLKFGVKQFD